MLYEGRGVPQDYSAATQWFRKAAAQGDYIVASVVGDMYSNGEGVTQDQSVAVSMAVGIRAWPARLCLIV
jgi:TPR repeat protein